MEGLALFFPMYGGSNSIRYLTDLNLCCVFEVPHWNISHNVLKLAFTTSSSRERSLQHLGTECSLILVVFWKTAFIQIDISGLLENSFYSD